MARRQPPAVRSSGSFSRSLRASSGRSLQASSLLDPVMEGSREGFVLDSEAAVSAVALYKVRESLNRVQGIGFRF